MELDIGEVSRRSGLRPSTLRFYEEKGLVRAIGRNGLRRFYGAGILDHLAMIVLGRAAGFSLDEIVRMLAPDGRPRIDRRVLAERAELLDRKVRELTAMRGGLRHAAACRAPSHMECPTFRRILRAAAAGSLGRPRARSRVRG
jgi:DNA-binding transcriptional MerR regulator